MKTKIKKMSQPHKVKSDELPRKVLDNIKKNEKKSLEEIESRPKELYRWIKELGMYFSMKGVANTIGYSTVETFQRVVLELCSEIDKTPPKFLKGKKKPDEGYSLIRELKSGIRRTDVPQFVFDRLNTISISDVLHYKYTRNRITIKKIPVGDVPEDVMKTLKEIRKQV
jgi:hypothetical protein